MPVADSELGNDPRLPVRSSRPSESLAGDRAGRAGRAGGMAGDNPTHGVAIVDATTLDEIDQLVAIALGVPDVVVVGSGLGGWCGRRASVRPTGPPRTLPDPCFPEPVVVVCASLHPVSRAQIAAVAEAGIRGGHVVAMTATTIRRPSPARSPSRAHQLVAGARAPAA